MQKTWGDIIAEARGEIWTFPGEAKPLIAPHTKYFHLAAMDLQHWIPELQVNNATQLKFCATYFNCGLTVAEAPIGLVKRVYTVANEEFCDQVTYDGVEYEDVECWSKNLLTYNVPDATGLRDLPMGFRDADSSSDSTCGRARRGIWARHRQRLYVAPWIQSNETLVVEWDGVKKEWNDADVLDTDLWDDRVINAIKMFVKWYHEKFHGCDAQKKLDCERDYANERADLIHYFAEITKERGEKFCRNERLPTAAELQDDVTPSAPVPLVIATVGDYASNVSETPGTTGVDPAASDGLQYRDEIAALVDSWNPIKFVGVGDIWYGSTSTLADLLARTPAVYQTYVDDGRYLPVIGNHDRDPVGHLPIILDYFTFPQIQTASGLVDSPGYYSVLVDPRVEIFVLDTGYNSSQVNQQADGVTETSKQAAWLQVALARSMATFKLVFGHHDPYTSFRSGATGPTLSNDGFLGYPEIRWPLKEWGAHAYFNGHIHAYERIEVNGFPYFTVGTGGREIKSFDEDNLYPGSEVRYAGYGAIKVTIGCDLMTVEFISRDGTVVDSREIEAT